MLVWCCFTWFGGLAWPRTYADYRPNEHMEIPWSFLVLMMDVEEYALMVLHRLSFHSSTQNQDW